MAVPDPRTAAEAVDEFVDILLSTGQSEALVESDTWTAFLKEAGSGAVVTCAEAMIYRGISLRKR